jgi:N-acylglucosamine-6-phosphate 2-epimerase
VSVDVTAVLPRGLVVSCQAAPGSPLRDTDVMVAMARAAEAGGAVAIRAEGAADVSAIKAATRLPVIGIKKVTRGSSPVYITPQFDDACELVDAGADIVALDGTARPRPHGEQLARIVSRIHELGICVMADVDSPEAGRYARDAGADVLATTLSGYMGGEVPDRPDFELVHELRAHQGLPVIAEGRMATPADVATAFAHGAYAVVVGTAITDLVTVTRRFAAAAQPSPDAGR